MTRQNRARRAQPTEPTDDTSQPQTRASVTPAQPAEPKPDLSWREFGRDSNIFSIANAVRDAYDRDGRIEEFRRISPRIIDGGHTYKELLRLFGQMVNFVDMGEDDDDDDDWSDLNVEPEE